jgi:hypothetical protein
VPTFQNNRDDAVHFTPLGITVSPGDTFEVSDEDAEGLRVAGFPEETAKKTNRPKPADTQDGEK